MKNPSPGIKEPHTGMGEPYDDILNLPRPVSIRHPRMAIENRAAQFSPFAALTGYDAAIEETARLTEGRVELNEDAKAALNAKLRVVADTAAAHPPVAVTYFRPDEKKNGGAYITSFGEVKKVDEYARVLVLMNGERIAVADVLEVQGELFKDLL